MPNLLREVVKSFLFGAAALILLFTYSWMNDKDEQVEELFSRLQECEKNHELKE